MSYSHMGPPTLPSALLRFTAEFGMGSGGTTVLLSLDKKVNSESDIYLPTRMFSLVSDTLFNLIRNTSTRCTWTVQVSNVATDGGLD